MGKRKENISVITAICFLLLLAVLRFTHVLPEMNMGYHHVLTEQEIKNLCSEK